MIFLCQENGDFAIIDNQMWLTDNSVSTVPDVAAQYPNSGQETLQLIRNLLRMNQGEEELDPSLGIPYFQQIFAPGTPLETVQAILYDAIAAVPGVLSISAFSVSVNSVTRVGTVTFTVQTSNGPVTSTESFP